MFALLFICFSVSKKEENTRYNANILNHSNFITISSNEIRRVIDWCIQNSKIMYILPTVNRCKKHTCFIIIVTLVAIMTCAQWLFLRSRQGKIILSRIQHGEVLIPGWEPFRSFQVTKYIRPNEKTALSIGTKVCPPDQNPNVLLVVCSHLRNFEMRSVIRKTWASDSYAAHNVSVAFMLGISEEEHLNKRILDENDEFGDLIVEDFMDTPFNATLKSVMMLKYANHNCPETQFLMKTDDDVFINVANVDRFVHNPSRVRPHLLVGKLMPNETVKRDSLNERYMPRYMYNYETYPDYLSGVGYLMSVDNVPLLYKNALASSYIHFEDVFITGICAEGAGINRLYDFRFYYIEGTNYKLHCEILFQQNLITHSHNLDSFTVLQDWEELKHCQQKPPSSDHINSEEEIEE